MQKFNLIEVVNAKASGALAKVRAMEDLPYKVKYRLIKQTDALAPAVKAYSDLQNAAMKKHGTRQMNDKGKWTGKYEFDGDSLEAFNVEIESNGKEDVEILDKIDWPADGEEKPAFSSRLNTDDMKALQPFFNFPVVLEEVK